MLLQNNYKEFEELGLGKIRVMNKKGKNGFPQFVLKDVCNILGIERNNAIKVLTLNGFDMFADTDMIYNPLKRGGSKRTEMVVVEEPALYMLTVKSRKHNAKKFKLWIIEKVIPAIATVGAYVLDEARDEIKKPGKLDRLISFIDDKENKFDELKKKIEYEEEKRVDLEESSDSYKLKVEFLENKIKDRKEV